MKDILIATCASCGERKELCDSCQIDNIKQPRMCKECLMTCMSTQNWEVIKDKFWIRQLVELGDTKSLKSLRKQI